MVIVFRPRKQARVVVGPHKHPGPKIHGGCGTPNYVCQGLNSHYFHIIGDGHQPNSMGPVYIPIIRIPIKGGMTIPKQNATFDHGTRIQVLQTAHPPRSVASFKRSMGRTVNKLPIHGSGQMKSYFTNLDFLEIAGDFPY